MQCPSPDQVLDYVEHDMAGSARLEFESHLDACDGCRQVVALTASSMASTRRVGRYQLLGLLDAGGMGSVFEAEDPELRRRVALKLLHPGLTREGELRREAQAIAALNHPAVVRVYDVGRADDRDFIVMELLRSGTLDDWLRSAGPPRSEIIAAFAPLANGLDAVHEVGIVHRDIKPANILLRDDQTLVLSDFGLSTIGLADSVPDQGGGGPQSPTQTYSGLAGTPAYMAPEQHEGRSATPRSDQYSFALCLREALGGKSAPALPGRAAQALERALSPDPERRFASVGAMWRAFSGGFGNRRRRVALGVLGAAAGVAILAAAPLGGPPACADEAGTQRDSLRGSIDAALDPDLRKRLDDAVDRWGASTVAACADDPELEAKRRCLRRERGKLEIVIAEVRERPDAPLERWQRALRLVDVERCDEPSERNARPESRFDAEVDHARAIAFLGDFSAAISELDRVIADAQGPPADPILPAALRHRALILLQRDQDEPALQDVERGYLEASSLGFDVEVALNAAVAAQISIWLEDGEPRKWLAAADAARRRLDPPHPDVDGEYLEALARTDAREGDHEGAIRNARAALALIGDEREPIRRGGLEKVAAQAYLELGKYAEARQALERSLEISVRQDRTNTTAYISSLGGLATIAGKQGRHTEQIELLKVVGYLLVNNRDASKMQRTGHRARLGEAYYELGRYPEAIAELEGLVADVDAKGGPPVVLAYGLNVLAWSYIEFGDPAAAVPLAERALLVAPPEQRAGTPAGALYLVTKGAALAESGRVDEGVKAFEQAIAVLVPAYGQKSPMVAWARQLRARTRAPRDPAAARREIQSSVEVYAAQTDPHTMGLVAAYEDLAEVELMLGGEAAARQNLQRAIRLRASSSGPDDAMMKRLRQRLHDLRGSG